MTSWWRVAGAGIAGGFILLGSCTTEPCSCPPVLEGVTVIDGNHQVGVAGQVLPQPITVRVEEKIPAGGPLPGRTVYFHPRTGSGSVSPSQVTTDANGQAQVTWTLGQDPGEHTLLVSIYWPEPPPEPDLSSDAIVTAMAQQTAQLRVR